MTAAGRADGVTGAFLLTQGARGMQGSVSQEGAEGPERPPVGGG